MRNVHSFCNRAHKAKSQKDTSRRALHQAVDSGQPGQSIQNTELRLLGKRCCIRTQRKENRGSNTRTRRCAKGKIKAVRVEARRIERESRIRSQTASYAR